MFYLNALINTKIIQPKFFYSIFMNNTENKVLREGDLVKRTQLANTLRKMQLQPDTFYVGEVADDFVNDLKALGGIITKEDLRSYR